MKILVVEDDEFRVQLFKRWLRGHAVTVAPTARQAIRLLRRRRFDVVFLDHDLGGRVLVDPADKNTGAEVARFMAQRGLRIKTIVHSHNPAGAQYVKELLPHAEVLPFGNALGEQWHIAAADAVADQG